MITSLGKVTATFQKLIKSAFESSDTDGDGLLTKEEFETFVANAPSVSAIVELSEDAIRAMFAQADTDNNEMLSIEEAQSTISAQSQELNAMTYTPSFTEMLLGETNEDESTATLFSYLDIDKDGTVSVEEVLAAFSKNAAAMYSKIEQTGMILGNDIDINA